MFVSSPYSPFFNSGLLARANTPGSSHHQTRRSSLPDSTTPRTSSSRKSTSAYYLSLQRRDQREQRSFLSLDIADSRLSERHGPQLIPPVPALPPLTLPVVSPLRSHFSSSNSLRSDSLRSLPLPDPKPAPSIMLPDPPPPPYSIHHTHRRTPPRLPELPVLPALQFPLPPTYTKTRPHPQRPLPSPPSPVSPLSPISNKLSPTDDDDPSPPHPRSSVLTKPKHLRSKKPKNLGIITTGINNNRHSKASVSTASTRVRRKNRWDALDALEGRRKPSIGTDSDYPPFVPPVPSQKKILKLENVFVKPTTFARPTKPLPRPASKSKTKPNNRPVPNFMSMSDDSDSEPNHHSSSSCSDHEEDDPHPHIYLNQNVPLDIDPLFEPEDIVLPAPIPVRPRPPSAEMNTRSYLDVEGDNEEEEEEEEEEEGIVLEATRCPAPLSSPPPKVVTPQPNHPSQRAWVSRVKGPVERPLNSKPSIGGGTVAPARKDNIIHDKDRTKSSKPSASSSSRYYHHHHPSSSSRRHKASTSTVTTRPNPHARNNHSHYKSFIELDMDDLLEQEGENPNSTTLSHSRKGEAEVELFEWRGRVGRGMAEGGGEWVWV